ncbi:MAG: tetratricopeptide repeat protein [Planctomycetota bacterium]|nr:tetratricopeptide repeat protein [Planctomycetota bacterium]
MKSTSAKHLICFAIILMSRTAVLGQDPGAAAPKQGEPPDPDAMTEEAIDLIEAGDLEEANNLARRANAIAPTLDKLKLVEGLLLIAMGKGPEAVRRLEYYNQTEVGKKDYRAHAAIGQIYMKSQTNRMARRSLVIAVRMADERKKGKPVRAHILMDLATVERRLNSPDKALEYAREAAESAPNDPGIQFRFAQLLSSSGSVDDYQTSVASAERTMRLLETKLRNEPFNKEHLDLLQATHSLRVEIHQQERARNPQNPSTAIRIAESLRASADIEWRMMVFAAREYALQALELGDQPEPEWQLLIARLAMECGGDAALEGARERVAKVLEARPDHEEAKNLAATIDVQLKAR